MPAFIVILLVIGAIWVLEWLDKNPLVVLCLIVGFGILCFKLFASSRGSCGYSGGGGSYSGGGGGSYSGGGGGSYSGGGGGSEPDSDSDSGSGSGERSESREESSSGGGGSWADNKCPDCDGTRGFGGYTGDGVCSSCHGGGERLSSGLNRAVFQTPLECTNCGGSGECPTCHSSGKV